jgi:hypothetical protein
MVWLSENMRECYPKSQSMQVFKHVYKRVYKKRAAINAIEKITAHHPRPPLGDLGLPQSAFPLGLGGPLFFPYVSCLAGQAYR